MSFNQLRLQQINSEWSARRVPYLSSRLGDGRRVGRFGGVLLLAQERRDQSDQRNAIGMTIGTTPKRQVLLTFPGSAWISQIRQQDAASITTNQAVIRFFYARPIFMVMLRVGLRLLGLRRREPESEAPNLLRSEARKLLRKQAEDTEELQITDRNFTKATRWTRYGVVPQPPRSRSFRRS